MKNLILLVMLSLSISAFAHQDEQDSIDALVQSGDITITFKPDGTATSVTCNTHKYTPKECEHLGEHIFDYYHKHKKD